MSHYHIEHRIKTLSELDDPFEFSGFRLSPWKFDPASGSSGDAWCAAKDVEAENFDEAFRTIIGELYPIVDRIAFVSQCFTMVELQPFLILKLNNNEHSQLAFRYTDERPVVPLNFGREEKASLEALEGYRERGKPFRLLREATIASSFYTRFVMLVAALEAIAGEVVDKKRGFKRKDGDYIRDEILKDAELYAGIFEPGTGIRNQLLHGAKVDLTSDRHAAIDYIDNIHKAILRYFREKHGINISQDIVEPLRNPTGNYRVWEGWLQPKDNSVALDLWSIHQWFKFTQDNHGSDRNGDFVERFNVLHEVPPDY